jgi:hypothetical protein
MIGTGGMMQRPFISCRYNLCCKNNKTNPIPTIVTNWHGKSFNNLLEHIDCTRMGSLVYPQVFGLSMNQDYSFLNIINFLTYAFISPLTEFSDKVLSFFWKCSQIWFCLQARPYPLLGTPPFIVITMCAIQFRSSLFFYLSFFFFSS